MRTAIVTGCGSDIGQAVGVALCAAGWTVVIAGRKVETLERTRQLAQGSGLIETHVADVTDEASVERKDNSIAESGDDCSYRAARAAQSADDVSDTHTQAPDLG